MHLSNHELIAFAAMFIACFALTRKEVKIGIRRADFSLQDSRSVHTIRIPRTAGIALLLAIVPTIMMTEGELRTQYVSFMLAASPILIISIYEDIISETRAAHRLVAILCSNFAVIAFFHLWLPRIGIPQLNDLMSGYGGLLLTVALITTITNSFNLIDGLNGLCSIFSVCAFSMINLIAEKYGLNGISHISAMYVAMIIAFTLFNFPLAKIYLGDTGAYFLGFLYCWLGVSILNQCAIVKAPSFMLIAAYPISEIIISVARRLISRSRVTGSDQLHFHHLILKIVKLLMPKVGTSWQNPIASIFLFPIYLAPMVYAYYNLEDRFRLILGFLVFFVIYTTIYVMMRRTVIVAK